MMFKGEPTDNEGYPTDEFLDWIRTCDLTKVSAMDFITEILDNWYHGDYGWRIKRKYNGRHTVYISTCGWSGNEEMIAALKSNYIFWSLFFYNHRTGGHYTFKIRDIQNKE